MYYMEYYIIPGIILYIFIYVFICACLCIVAGSAPHIKNTRSSPHLGSLKQPHRRPMLLWGPPSARAAASVRCQGRAR